MKTFNLCLFFIVIVVFLSCKNDEESITIKDLTFSRLELDKTNSSFEIKEIIVGYDEILAYDSAQHVFQLDEQAWGRMKSKITPIYPDPNFGFGVIIDDQLMYKVSYIPGYHSYSYPEIIKFEAVDPNCILLWYGHYEGNENVNDLRIIELLSKDGKLKSIDL